ncbi:hypothetical protein ASE00_05710 [Sphingomonas sp. Root710]|uniref:acyltransferase family protein n=1 Tax=Sphingomonas sp. Root710 TaxID=1736594 RepID=UPI0006FB2E53|nr:acyltransferase [Sphingomonas sp. Root710]KRB86225.1 hypothetical protein ASE00_05710 [Sphingomonas sp. Root710]
MGPDISDSIRVARVIGILGLVMIHVPPWRIDLGDPPRSIEAFDLFFLYCQELFGRASVPLLSVISGYLMVQQHGAMNAATRLRKKARSLLIPLVGWNLIAVLLTTALTRHAPYTTVGEWTNGLLAISKEPAIRPLYFLRDIFLCALLFPLIRLAIDRAPVATLTLVAIVSLAGWTYPLFIGSGPLLFFTAGVAIALGKLSAEPDPRQKRLLMIAALLVPGFTAAVMVEMLVGPASAGWLQLAFTIGLIVERICVAWFVWIVARWTLRQRWNPLIQAIEPYIFIIFCSHVLWLALAWHLLEAAGISYDHPLYPLFFATAPLQALLAGLGAAMILRRISPALLGLLCGGRVPPRTDWSAARRPVRNPS